ncbi:MAG: hypothetical protein QM731_25010 [Chitinophagaceae bacterium]
MAYSAYVCCNCYRSGNTTEPPYKEFIYFDEEELFIEPPSDLYEKDRNKAIEIYTAFDNWQRTACQHEDMKLAYEHLANISGMGSFKHILNKLGGKNRFPVLTEYLPTSNDGSLPAAFVQQALSELNELENDPTIHERIILTEKKSDCIIAAVDSEESNLFAFGAYTHIYGIDNQGFFIVKKISEQVTETVFRSINFIQQEISVDKYKFTDIPTGNTFDSFIKLYSYNESAEFEFKRERQSIGPEFKYIITPLKILVEASIQSGNPIHWL